MLKINIAQQLIMGILEHTLLWIYPGKCVARKYLPLSLLKNLFFTMHILRWLYVTALECHAVAVL